MTLSDHQGSAVVVHFWATWCPTCLKETPKLIEHVRELALDFTFLAVTLDEDWGPVQQVFGGQVPPEVYRQTGDGAQEFGVKELPDTFILDAKGRFRAHVVGPGQDWKSQRALRYLSEL
jgi:thiol-disulfide isomerase/thioredoxin